MENIGSFLSHCQTQLEVPKGDLFQTVDLYEKQNMHNVSKTFFVFVLTNNYRKF